MMRFLADENFDNRILRGVQRENADIDVVRVQDTAIYQADDPTVLEWAAENERILLTHDISTMPKYAYERIEAGEPMPGIIVVNPKASMGDVIEDILLVLAVSEEEEFKGQVVYLPLK
jgi:predicted nuclease of predicted toxin-antitoxin system